MAGLRTLLARTFNIETIAVVLLVVLMYVLMVL